MHKAESVLENWIHKLLLDFEIQTNHVISIRRSDQVVIRKKNNKKQKKTCHQIDFSFWQTAVQK